MRMSRTVDGCILLSFLLPYRTLMADTITFTPPGTIGVWSVPSNWDLGRAPMDGDHAVIPVSKICNVDITGAVCDSFEVQGTLNINAGKNLTIDATSTVAGLVFLNGLDSKLAVVLPAGGGNVTISGTGDIVGEDSAAMIHISPLTSGKLVTQVDITGRLKITGSGQFANEGRVICNLPGTIRVEVSGGITDTEGDRWVVNEFNCNLHFADTLPSGISLAGNFLLDDRAGSNSSIRVDQAIVTTGRLEMYSGLLDVRADLTMGSDNPQNPKHMLFTADKIVVAAGKKFEHK